MKTKSIKNRNVEVSERLLKSLKGFKELVVTDRKLFYSFGVSADKINLYESSVNKFEKLHADERLNELIKEKSISLRNQRIYLIQRIQVVSSMINAFWNKHQTFGYKHNFINVDSVLNAKLTNIGRVVILFAHNHKKELRSFGLTDEILYELSMATNTITVLSAEIEVYKMELILQKTIQKSMALELIEQTKFFARVGRSIWAQKDMDKWSSYKVPNLIYRTADVDIG